MNPIVLKNCSLDIGSVRFGWVGLCCACLPNGGEEGFVWVGFGQTICLYFFTRCVLRRVCLGRVGLGLDRTGYRCLPNGCKEEFV